MAETVGSHTIATFTSPVNGTTPIDANTVRGNDNVIQTAYNAHDTDPGIHIQSSALASRPAAGTAGRKWMTVDGTVQRLWYDTGSVWLEVQAAALSTARTLWGQSFDGSANVSGSLSSVTDIGMSGTLTIGGDVALSRGAANRLDLASGDNFNLVNGAYLIGAASVLSATTLGSSVVNSSLTGVGTLTSGAIGSGFSPIANSALANSSVTVNGVSIALGASGTVAAAASTLTGTTLASNVVNSSLTSVGTLTSLTVTNPISGSVTGSAGSVAASALTGTTLASGVTASSLTSVGTLTSLTVSGNTSLKLSNPFSSYTLYDGLAVQVGSGLGVGILSASSAHNAYLAFGYGTTTSQQYSAFIGRLGVDTLAFGTGNAIHATLNASGNLAVDTNTLFVDAVNNRVGVKTASPTEALHIAGIVLSAGPGNQARYSVTDTNSGGATAYLNAAFAGTGTPAVQVETNHPLLFVTNNTERMRLDASGNLGLGVTPSAWSGGRAIEVGVLGNCLWGFGANELYQLSNAYFNAGFKYAAAGTATQYLQYNGTHQWLTASSGAKDAAIAFTQAMTLDANGNLLVGLTSTIGAAKAAVAGTILSSTNTLSTFSGAYGGFDWVSRSLRVFAGSADATNSQIEFYAGVSGSINERFRIKGPGQVRFIPLAAAPTTNVEDGDVYYDSSTNKLRVRAGGAWTDLH